MKLYLLLCILAASMLQAQVSVLIEDQEGEGFLLGPVKCRPIIGQMQTVITPFAWVLLVFCVFVGSVGELLCLFI